MSRHYESSKPPQLLNNYKKETEGSLFFEMAKAQIQELAADLVKNNIGIQLLRPVHSLEEYFLAQTNH